MDVNRLVCQRHTWQSVAGAYSAYSSVNTMSNGHSFDSLTAQQLASAHQPLPLCKSQLYGYTFLIKVFFFFLHHFFIIYNVVILAWPFGPAHTDLARSHAEPLTRNEN